jgi:hypothetical protein
VAVRAGTGDAFEVAVLAGLLARYKEPTPELAEAEKWRDGDGDALLNEVIANLSVEGIASGVLYADESDEVEERMDALLELDEVCAGLRWCDATFRIRDEIDLVTRTIEAFPEPWLGLRFFASAVLRGGQARPLRDDPARRMWACVEATAG